MSEVVFDETGISNESFSHRDRYEQDEYYRLFADVDSDTLVDEVNLAEYHHEVNEGRHYLVSGVERVEVIVGSPAMKHLCRICKVPAKFIEKCSDSLVADIFAEFYPSGDKPVVKMVTMQNRSILRAVLPEKVSYTSNLDVYRAWLDVLASDSSDIVVDGGNFHSPETELIWNMRSFEELSGETGDYDLTFAAQMKFSELNPKFVTINPLLQVNGVYLPVFVGGVWRSMKYSSFDIDLLKSYLENLRGDVNPEVLIDVLRQNLNKQVEVLKWVEHLERQKGVPSSALKESRERFHAGEEMSVLNLILDILKPYQTRSLGSLGFERAVVYQLSQ